MTEILITGTAGFIGSSLAEFFLNNGYKVTGIDNFDLFYDRSIKEKNLAASLAHPNFRFIEADITKPVDFEKLNKRVDVVIHIAAKAGVLPSIKNPLTYIQTNITGTQNLLMWMKEKEVSKLLFASSSSVYGNQNKIPFSENDSVDHPISPYAFTKKSCELMNFNYHYLYNFDIINLRFFTVFGPRQRPDLAIHKFVKMIDNNEPITMYGDGSTARDYTYITDIIQGVNSALNYLMSHKNIFETVNLGNSSPTKLIDLIHLLYELKHKSPQINQLPLQSGDVTNTFADISKAKKLFGYSPQVKFKEGLSKFIDWYKLQIPQ